MTLMKKTWKKANFQELKLHQFVELLLLYCFFIRALFRLVNGRNDFSIYKCFVNTNQLMLAKLMFLTSN